MAKATKHTKNRRQWQQIPQKELHDALGRILVHSAQPRRFTGEEAPERLHLPAFQVPLLP